MHQCKKHGKKVHEWACFSYNGVGGIELFEENLTSNKIVTDILQKHLSSSAEKLKLCFNFYYFLLTRDYVIDLSYDFMC